MKVTFNRGGCAVAVALLLLLYAQYTIAQETQPAVAQEPAAEATECAECHSSKGPRGEQVSYAAILHTSIHAELSCETCHSSIDMENFDPSSPHPHGEVQPVHCGDCHEKEADEYKSHGRLAIGDNHPDLPACWDCHGTHDIVAISNPRSRVDPANLAGTCQRCHTDVNIVKRHDVLRDAPIKTYQNSVHGEPTKIGLSALATCIDCHAAVNEEGNRTAHRILSPVNDKSPIYHFNIPQTCGGCHRAQTKDYLRGIHGQALLRGEVEAPVCTTCHGEHGIVKKDDPRSPVNPAHIAEQTCAPCHESAVLNQKYGLPGGRLASYIDSYHGLKSKAGDTTVANCASCHREHLVLPSSDPESSINPQNLRKTCGSCHPGITAQLAQTPIHGTGAGLYTGWADIFRKVYLVVIAVTIGLMLLHNVADWRRYVKNMLKQPYVQRLSPSETAQHWVLMIAFIVLVITGFALRYSDAWWVKLLFGFDIKLSTTTKSLGGSNLRAIIHRMAAVVLIVSAVWHMLYVLSRRGRQWIHDMTWTWSDFRHIWENSLYFLGRRDEEARFGRFSYMEKAEYWALVWGTIIMSVTGLFLWFDTFASRFVPKGFLDVMLVIHYYEAWLATLAILVWHIYGTMFRPSVWPMNPSWIAGRMPKIQYMHEHPEGPKLKARVSVPRYEEEIEESPQPAGASDQVPATVHRDPEPPD